MYRRSFLALGGTFLASGCAPAAQLPLLSYRAKIDPITQDRIRTLTSLFPAQRDNRARLETISQSLLGTPYQAHHLIGSATQPEELVVDLRSVDCLSFLEYVTALNSSTSENEFLGKLVQTRYVNNTVSFSTRRHFLSDWCYPYPVLGDDITKKLSSQSVSVVKTLNQKADGSLYLPGISIKKRVITYIPSASLDTVYPQLRTGDLIGIYSNLPGLDVSHTGFAICNGETVVFRNASSLSAHPYVVDIPLKDYVANKRGITVIRLKDI
ncbi:DUF1460 domain-containing protein [Saccharibacter sp. 17.LH.SD]|uniref:N-acetylmuramoyl-L-alanine amidase-like domain-containing protein n=1 Tax=Saccharibacter sp. 17.LH.SD TaxID=2689393 RepID=UPI00136B40BF|nr:N-acetylmuramoyl-L-alanine amidase-like domain-containing protein [Saccharibacter sp. 17.LH.SD]MXV43715.1 DUF1460 domain-containing protein [Saccharibacter sp. 17.LH.SD]